MRPYPPSVVTLIKNLSRLPGIGEKSAQRLAMHILHAPETQVRELGKSIIDVKEKVRVCQTCFCLSDGDLCGICSDPGRDPGVICVVESHSEMVAIEKSGVFTGKYHVLGGTLSPMEGIGPDDLRILELFHRINDQKVLEVVLATGTGTEGEATAAYLTDALDGYSVKVTRIATGVPMGGDIQYADMLTLKRAMEGRTECRKKGG